MIALTLKNEQTLFRLMDTNDSTMKNEIVLFTWRRKCSSWLKNTDSHMSLTMVMIMADYQ